MKTTGSKSTRNGNDHDKETTMETTAPNSTVADDYIARLAEQIDELDAQVRRDLKVPVLTTKERQARAKPRPGGNQTGLRVMKLAKRYHIEVPGASPDEVVQMIASAQRAQLFLAATQTIHQTASDAVFDAESTAWGFTTIYYSFLVRYARSNPRLRLQLKPLNEVFNHRSASVRKEQVAERADRKAARAARVAAKTARQAEGVKARQQADAEEVAAVPVVDGAHTTNGVGGNGVHADA